MQRFNQARITHQSRVAQALLGSGDNSAVAPPVPIPNTAVKRCSPDGSTAIGCARVGRRQNKMPGEFISSGILLWYAYSSREWSRRESSDIDGQARPGSGRVSWSERINRTPPVQNIRRSKDP